MKLLIHNATIVNEAKEFKGSLIVDDDLIADIITDGSTPTAPFDRVIDATGCYVMPGVIDSHVHFREPGLTDKADIESESRAAAAGGVTTFFDMPNTVPQTTSVDALDAKFRIAREKSHVNYSFFFGATNSNADALQTLDRHVVRFSHSPGSSFRRESAQPNNFREVFLPLLFCRVNISRTPTASAYPYLRNECPYCPGEEQHMVCPQTESPT